MRAKTKIKTNRIFKFNAELWLYKAPKAAWHFITVPLNIASEIYFRDDINKFGWGSVKVSAKIGRSELETSIFPDKKSGCYFLPVKAEIRKKENLIVGKSANVIIEV